MQPSKQPTKPIDPIRDRLKQTRLRLLDAADALIENLAQKPAAVPPPPPAVMRRLGANTLKLWNFCANKKCRRTKCCRGEPLDCLHLAMPLMTAEDIAAILPKPGRPNRSRRREVALPADQR